MKIGKQAVVKFTTNREDQLLLGHLLDLYVRSMKLEKGCCSHFLDERQLLLATRFLQYQNIPYWIESGPQEATKAVLWFYEPGKEIITFRFSNPGITHSHLLGTLFSLGLEVDQIGDIFVEEAYVYFTCLSSLETVFVTSLVSVRGYVISLEKVDSIFLTEEHLVRQVYSVSSLRIDVVLAKIMKKSRGQVEMALQKKDVLYNYQPVHRKSDLVLEGDIFSIRHVGKFKIGKIEGTSRKGSLFLEVFQYC